MATVRLGICAGNSATPGMVAIPESTFTFGSDRHYPEERPARQVQVDAFLIDRYPVTNLEFAKFVSETGYVTVAERVPDPADYPGALPEMLHPGSLVFIPPRAGLKSGHWSEWWEFVFGADWRHPEGPDTSIDDRMDHPVVHVAYCDARAFADWAGKSLPSEAQWECAARGGLEDAEFAWGDELTPGDVWMANTWQGRFPLENLVSDGFARTSPRGIVPFEWVRAVRYDRQRMGVDNRLVCASARSFRGQAMLHAKQSARRP